MKIRKKIFKMLKEHEWRLLGLLVLITFALGIVGFMRLGENFLNSFYYSLQLFVLQSSDNHKDINVHIHIARLLSPAVVAFATIKSFFNIFQKDLGLLRIKNHVVICGLSSESHILIQDLISRKMKVVLIESSASKQLHLNLRTEGTILINEFPSDMNALKKAGLRKAKAVFVMNEKDELNIEIVTNIHKLFGQVKTDKKVLCCVHIYEPTMESVFKSHAVFQDPGFFLDTRIVNVYRIGSEILINEIPLVDENFLRSKNQLHVMILGLGRTGKSILIQLALFYHYSKERKLKLTLIDRNAEAELTKLRNEYPSVYDLLDVEYREIDIEKLNDDNFYSGLKEKNYTAVYCCAGNDVLRISVIKKLCCVLRDTKFFISFQRDSNLTNLICECNVFNKEQTVKIFNLYEKTCTYEKLVNEEVEQIARVIHRKYCESERLKGVTEKENLSLKDWWELPELLREANRKQAFHIKLKIEAFGYHLVPLNSPEEAVDISSDTDLLEKMSKSEHIRWVDEKLLDGWKYAPGTKNISLKTHPDLIPYEELSESAKEKDRDIVRNLPELLKLTGKKIARII